MKRFLLGVAIAACASAAAGQAIVGVTLSTVGGLPSSCVPGQPFIVTDAASSSDCATGAGSTAHWCFCNAAGNGYVAQPAGGITGPVSSVLDSVPVFNNTSGDTLRDPGSMTIDNDSNPTVSFTGSAPNFRFFDTDVSGSVRFRVVSADVRFEADPGNVDAGSQISFYVDNTEAFNVDASQNLNPAGLVDGVDIAAHAANASAHHTKTTSASDLTSGTLADARVDGSLEADELVLVGDVDGAANANDLDEVAVEAELESVLDLADLQGTLGSSKITDGDLDPLDFNADGRASPCFQVIIGQITTADELEIELPNWPGTMLDFRCEAQGGTSFTVNLCDGEDLGDDTCTTSILGGTLICSTTGNNDNTLSAADFDANDSVSLVVTAVSGSVSWARVKMNCRKD